MAAPSLGTKWTCFKCSAKFYDMKKPAPVCPKCGIDQREAPPAPKPGERRRAAPKVVEREVPDVDSEPETEEDEDEDDE